MRSALCALLVSASMLAPPALAVTEAPSADARAAEAERIVFLLQYVGSDYAAAVRDGRVVDEAEYRENREFTSMIAERFAELRPAVPAAKARALDDSLQTLVRLVEAHGDAGAVKAAAEAAIPVLIEAFGLRSFPRQRPDPVHAAELFAEDCTPCHGVHGDGDGPRAKELDPPPARLSDPDRLDGTAPYVFYNAITLGVGTTPMASFADSLSDQERWDLAFYPWTFRAPPSPERTPPPVRLSLRDLATRSSRDLAPEVMRQALVRGQAIDAKGAALWVARLRAEPPVLSDSEERLARMRQDLAASIALVEQGKLDQASDRVTTSYLTEFEPLEPEIDRHDRSVRQRFERGLIDFREALRRNDRAGALGTARGLLDSVDRADALLTTKPIPRAWKWGAALGIVVAAALAAIVVRSRRIGKARAVG